MVDVSVFNRLVDRNRILIFRLDFKLNGVFIDISTWEFNFLLTNGIGVVKWDIQNADFTRPANYSIMFQKTPEEVFAEEVGNYNISLLATYSGMEYPDLNMINNEIMKGTWYFN